MRFGSQLRCRQPCRSSRDSGIRWRGPGAPELTATAQARRLLAEGEVYAAYWIEHDPEAKNAGPAELGLMEILKQDSAAASNPYPHFTGRAIEAESMPLPGFYGDPTRVRDLLLFARQAREDARGGGADSLGLLRQPRTQLCQPPR